MSRFTSYCKCENFGKNFQTGEASIYFGTIFAEREREREREREVIKQLREWWSNSHARRILKPNSRYSLNIHYCRLSVVAIGATFITGIYFNEIFLVNIVLTSLIFSSMALFFKRVQRVNPSNPAAPKRWYPILKSIGLVKEKEVAKMLAVETTLNPKEAV